MNFNYPAIIKHVTFLLYFEYKAICNQLDYVDKASSQLVTPIYRLVTTLAKPKVLQCPKLTVWQHTCRGDVYLKSSFMTCCTCGSMREDADVDVDWSGACTGAAISTSSDNKSVIQQCEPLQPTVLAQPTHNDRSILVPMSTSQRPLSVWLTQPLDTLTCSQPKH